MRTTQKKLTRSGASLSKVATSMTKKYGKDKYTDFLKKERNKQLIAAGAQLTVGILGLAGAAYLHSEANRNFQANLLTREKINNALPSVNQIKLEKARIDEFMPSTVKLEPANIKVSDIIDEHKKLKQLM